MYITPNAKRKIKEVYMNLASAYGMIQDYEELKSPISDKRLEEVVCKIVNHIGLDKDFNFAELVETYNYHS